MRVEPPTDADARRRPAGKIDLRLPVVCILERSCYSEHSFTTGTRFHAHSRTSHLAYEFHRGAIEGLPVLLVVLEPRSDSTQSAVLALRHAAPQGISALVLGGTALPLVSSLGEGQLVVISDHINLLGYHPLVDRTAVGLGHGFPDMSRAYDERLRECVESEAAALSQSAGRGVYLACEEDMDAMDPFVRAAVDAGACVRGSGIAPIAVLGAALRVPVVAAVLVNGNAACHGAPDACSREERKTMLAQALARGVFGVREEYRTEVRSHGALRSRETHTAVLTKSRTSVVLRVS